MKSKKILIAFGIVGLVAILTNPNKERYKDVIREKLSLALASTQENLEGTGNEWAKAGQAIGMVLGDAVVDNLLNNSLFTSNYIFFSTCRMTWQGNTRTIGVGAFGNVFLFVDLQDLLRTGHGESSEPDEGTSLEPKEQFDLAERAFVDGRFADFEVLSRQIDISRLAKDDSVSLVRMNRFAEDRKQMRN